MKRFLNNAARAVPALAILISAACGSDGSASGDMTVPTTATSSPAGAGAVGAPTAGKGTAGAAGVSSASAAVGGGVAGTRGSAGTAAGMLPASSGRAGAGGMMTSAAGTGGTTAPAAGASSNAAGASGASGASGAPAAGASANKRPLSSSLKLAPMMETPGVAPFFHVWRPSDLSAVEGKLPVVVWNNGACSRNDQVFKPLFDKWAGGGWVVLSLTSGGGSSQTTIADQKGLIDWVVAQADMAGGAYNGKLDLDRIVAGGNSCGGITSLGLAAMDDRVSGIFVLSGSSGMGGANTMVTNAIKIPVAYVVGGTEDIARANAEADYEAFKPGIASMIVSRSSGDHLMISNNADVMKDAADISMNWLDLTMFGLQGALDALKTPTVCSGCASGLWTMTGKNLETLVK